MPDLDIFLAIVFFCLFLYLLYYAAKLFVKFIAVVGLFALFPIIMVKVFGVGWTLNKELVISFALLGVAGFIIYYCLYLLELFFKSFLESSKHALGVKKRGRHDDD